MLSLTRYRRAQQFSPILFGIILYDCCATFNQAKRNYAIGVWFNNNNRLVWASKLVQVNANLRIESRCYILERHEQVHTCIDMPLITCCDLLLCICVWRGCIAIHLLTYLHSHRLFVATFFFTCFFSFSLIQWQYASTNCIAEYH